MAFIETILMAASLCADCLAVSLCSGLALRDARGSACLRVALSFAVIHVSLLLAGWALGFLFAGLVEKISHVLAFVLLLYVGGAMLFQGIRGKNEVHDLTGWHSVLLCGVAVSIDALAVGVAQSLEGVDFPGLLPLLVSLFVVTVLTVMLGLCGGRIIGVRFGRWAEIVGGIVLIAIGVTILL